MATAPMKLATDISEPILTRPTSAIQDEIALPSNGSFHVSGENMEALTHTSEDESSLTNTGATVDKRARKKVERLSESLNRNYEVKQQARAKNADDTMAALKGKGTALGDIPLIEASIRKSKPADLKVIHLAAFGRPGSANEIRSHLRKFCGYAFSSDSSDFSKRSNSLSNRTATELRDALRQLHLEVSGSRPQLVSRLLEFLACPMASTVKYKGKLKKSVSKRGRKSTTKQMDKTSPKKAGKLPRGRPPKAKVADDDDEEQAHSPTSDIDAESSAEDDTLSSPSVASTPPPNKRAKSAPKSAEKPPAAKRVRRIAVVDDESSEDEVPLSAMVAKKPAFPSDEELRTKVFDLLKKSNLEETSMKVVRSAVFEQYPDLDLSSKKQFVNGTIKEYLAGSI